jgi:hypothetical protein
MQGKLLVALQLEVVHHFIERCAGGRSRRSEPPATFRASKTAKTLLFNPHQFPPHGRLCRCAASPSDRMPGTRLRVKERNDLIRHNVSLGNGVLPDYSRNRWAQGKMCWRNGQSLHAPILGSLSGILHSWKISIAQAGPALRASRCLAGGSGEANVGRPTEASCLHPV